MTTGALSLVVTKAEWSVFATLTTRQEHSPERLSAQGLRWLRWASHVSGKRFAEFVYLMRLERGEIGDRLHLHALMCVPAHSLGYFVVRQGFVPVAHKAWKLGLTRFRRVHGRNDQAVAYLLKNTEGGDEYEFTKTTKAHTVVISNGLWRLARATSKGVTATACRMNPSDEHTSGRLQLA